MNALILSNVRQLTPQANSRGVGLAVGLGIGHATALPLGLTSMGSTVTASEYLAFEQLHRGPKTDDPACGTALGFSPAAGLLAVGSHCATVSGHRRHAASTEVADSPEPYPQP